MRKFVGVRSVHLKRLLVVGLLAAVVALVVGCSDNLPQNTLAPKGDVAKEQRDLLFFWVLGPAIAIFVVVEAVLVYALFRFRQRRGDALPQQVHGNTRLEIAWTIAPAILLIVIAVPTIGSIINLGREPADDALRVNVTGVQWRWLFEYPDIVDAEGEPLQVIDDLHIPVGREISVSLESLDVVHSFWVPRLAGKLDAIPGRTNRMWFNATSPGAYSGQCAEFCGLGHADMRLIVFAESEEDFQEWVNGQLEEQQAAGSGETGLVPTGE
jgi:cytochrome c oxidase subunit 2